MNKTLIYALLVLVVLVGGFFVLNSYIYNEKQGEIVPGETVVRSGRVQVINMEQAAFDGPFLITIQSADDESVTIAIPSMGLPFCAGIENIEDVSEVAIGDTLQVKGVVSDDGSIVPCESSDHYLRVVQTENPDVVPPPGPITIKGEITCLPKKGPGPHTMECAIGLKGVDGNYYALKNLFDHDPGYAFSETGLQISVSGTFSKDAVSGPGGSTYDIVGSIEIGTIEKDTEGQEISLQEGERESSFLVQEIFSDRVEGLNYPEYPIAMGDGLPVALRVGEMVSNGCTITLTLERIEGDTAIFLKKTDFGKPCPICLSAGTEIDTSEGRVRVEEIERGMTVWTINKNGERVLATVLKTSKALVPETHAVVRVLLADGRDLFVSPGHPTADGRHIGELVVGDMLDGSRIAEITRIPYTHAHTYDILPSGETGFYFANGILLGSTLK